MSSPARAPAAEVTDVDKRFGGAHALRGVSMTFYPSLWFPRKWGGAETERLLPVEPLLGWVERVAALGYGDPTEITGAMALDIARGSAPAACEVPADGDPTGLKAGARVTVTADDVGRDPVEGVLVGADDREVVIRRSDPRVGVVHVHFPRAGYDVVSV